MSENDEIRPLLGKVAKGRVAQFRSSVKATSGGSTWRFAASQPRGVERPQHSEGWCRRGELSRVYFYSGPEDTRALASFFLEKKMSLVSTRFDDVRDVQADDLVEQRGCYVSPVPLDQIERNEFQRSSTDPLQRDIIHPYRQPVISWRRSSIDGQYLIAGDLEWVEWSGGSPVYPSEGRLLQLNAEAGKAFRSARRWIGKHWRIENGFWYGPEATRLRDAGLTPTSFHTDKVKFSTVTISDSGGKTIVEQSADEFFDTERK